MTTLWIHAWSRPRRILAGTLLAVSGLGVPLLFAAVVLAVDPPVTPPVLLRLFLLQIAAPALAAAAVRRASRAELEVGAAVVTILTAGQRIEVPRDAIVALEPWRVPLPGPALAVRLRSGRRLAWGLEARDPDALLDALGVAGPPRPHPTVRWAHARAARVPGRWWRVLARYPLFALPFAALFFYTHQHIAYGGFFGQWNLQGLFPWLSTLLEYWTTVLVYFLLWGGCCRGAAEAVAWLVAAVTPAHAARGRRGAERVDAVAYFGGIAAFTALRYLA